jgi:hypothetical protein
MLKDGLKHKITMKTCKSIHGEASSSTLVEDLASHENKRQSTNK